MNLKIVSILPEDYYFYNETLIQLSQFREENISQYVHILVYIPLDRELNYKWEEIELLFPETKFFYYRADKNITQLINVFSYIPLLRIYCWMQYLKENSPENVLYIDSDVLLPKGLYWIEPFLEDNIVYQSNTDAYLNSDYLLSKEKDVLPHKLEHYKQRDVLQEFAQCAGITKEKLIEGKNKTGGAQTLLKGKSLTVEFWEDVLNSCLNILTLSRILNKEFFPSENKGFQTWALGDMGGLLWTLWKYNIETSTPKEFDFAWATDRIEKYESVNIYHNAGATIEPLIDGNNKKHIIYNKKGFLQIEPDGYYMSYTHMWNHPSAENPFTHPQKNISKEYCSYKYAEQINKTKKKFKL